MFLRLYWKLGILELLGALGVLIFFAPTLRAFFVPSSVTVLERTEHRAVVELVLPSYQVETRQGASSYSAIALDAPGWTVERDVKAGSALLPVFVYRLPAASDTMRADLHILEQETEKQSLNYPLASADAHVVPGTTVRAYLDRSSASPTVVIEWCPFVYAANSRELLVQRRVKIQIEN